VLNPTPAVPAALTPSTVSEAETESLDSLGTGIASGASGYVVDLWIDLISQVASSESRPRLPSGTGLTTQQFRALNCLHSEPLTIRGLARCLGISAAAAISTADRLVTAGAVERFRDTLDSQVVRLVATVEGIQMAADYLATQVAVLESLLNDLEPDRRAVLALAMKEIAKAMEWTSVASVDSGPAPVPKRSRWN